MPIVASTSTKDGLDMSNSKNLPDTGLALRLAMSRRNIKCSDLAARAGLSIVYLSKLRTGRALLQGEMLNKIAAALGMKSSELLALGED